MPTVDSLATLVGGTVVGDGTRDILDLAELRSAGPTDLSFLANPKYQADFDATRAGAVLVTKAVPGTSTTLIVCENPYLGMAQIATALHPAPEFEPGIEAGAWVHPDATVDPTATVRATCVVDAGAVVKARARLEPGAYVGRRAVIGEDALLYPGARVLDRCVVGARSILHPGVVVGADGFGYAPDATGKRHKIPQVGTVELGEDVEVGANTTIDRATFGVTRIGAGSKLDNLIQIAHNVQLGEHVVMASQSGIAGSSTLGDRVVVGAQAGITGHVTVGDDITLTARAGVTKGLFERGVFAGFPARPHRRWLREAAHQRGIPELTQRVQTLEKNTPTPIDSPAGPGAKRHP